MNHRCTNRVSRSLKDIWREKLVLVVSIVCFSTFQQSMHEIGLELTGCLYLKVYVSDKSLDFDTKYEQEIFRFRSFSCVFVIFSPFSPFRLGSQIPEYPAQIFFQKFKM